MSEEKQEEDQKKKEDQKQVLINLKEYSLYEILGIIGQRVSNNEVMLHALLMAFGLAEEEIGDGRKSSEELKEAFKSRLSKSDFIKPKKKKKVIPYYVG